MIYKTVLLARLVLSFLDAWLWYEDRQAGLGDRFKEVLYNRLLEIEASPERFPIRKRYYREARTDVFPYLIIYRINKTKKTVAVVSIFHASRNPRFKYR